MGAWGKGRMGSTREGEVLHVSAVDASERDRLDAIDLIQVRRDYHRKIFINKGKEEE